jgi:cation:H+ antiporter
MEIVWAIIFLVVGFALLIKGADYLVEGASALAKGFGVSDIVIGLTIVSMGTSAPELVVNVGSAWAGKMDFVYGNVVGSNIFNTLLILGIAGLIYPLRVLKSTGRAEVPISLFAVVMVYVLSNDPRVWGSDTVIPPGSSGVLSRFDGILLLVAFVAFLLYVFRNAKSEPSGGDIVKTMPNWKSALFIAVGITGLILGGNGVLSGAVTIATHFGLSERIIGLTIIAAGTSLPELATSVVAAMKKNSDIAIGNVVGSNIFNIFFILGLTATVTDVPYNIATNFDLYALMFATLLLFVMLFFGTRYKNGYFTLDRWQAFVLILGYVGYTTYLVLLEVYK